MWSVEELLEILIQKYLRHQVELGGARFHFTQCGSHGLSVCPPAVSTVTKGAQALTKSVQRSQYQQGCKLTQLLSDMVETTSVSQFLFMKDSYLFQGRNKKNEKEEAQKKYSERKGCFEGKEKIHPRSRTDHCKDQRAAKSVPLSFCRFYNS